jgi:hypothetical protein
MMRSLGTPLLICSSIIPCSSRTLLAMPASSSFCEILPNEVFRMSYAFRHRTFRTVERKGRGTNNVEPAGHTHAHVLERELVQ